MNTLKPVSHTLQMYEIQSAPHYQQIPHLQIQPTTDKKKIQKRKKLPENTKKQNFNLSRAGIIYIAFY